MISELVAKTRSCRRFKQTPAVTRQDLEGLVDLARVGSSGGNLQPLAYYLAADAEVRAKIFPCLKWAGYLKDWTGPADNERPTGYIVVLRDNDVTSNFTIDHGVASEIMRLAATEKGWASCIIGSLDRLKLRAELEISNKYEILLVLAFGAAGEVSVVEPVKDGNIRYYRDAAGTLHVPKRSLKDVLVN